jgi:hypothetical protein
MEQENYRRRYLVVDFSYTLGIIYWRFQCFNFANNYVRLLRYVITYFLFGQEESETGLGEAEDEERLNVSALHIFIAMYANFLSSFLTFILHFLVYSFFVPQSGHFSNSFT